MYVMIPGALIATASTISTTTFGTNEDGTLNKGALMSTVTMGATTTSTENISININAESEKQTSFAKTYVESMSDEELSDLFERIDGIYEEPIKIYQK